MSKLFNHQREKDRCLLAMRSAHGVRASSQSRASVHEVAPSRADLFSRVASSLCSSYLNCGKMAQTKNYTQKSSHKKKQSKRRGGRDVQVPHKMPWEAKGWTQQQWLSWKQQRQPDSSSSHATVNPSWWVRKGMKFRGGGRALQEIRYFQKHMQLLIRKLPFSW